MGSVSGEVQFPGEESGLVQLSAQHGAVAASHSILDLYHEKDARRHGRRRPLQLR